MGVIRVQKNSNYVVMNKTALHDPRLSWKAKGLHAYMLSMPDDWKFYDDELEKHAKDGKDALKSAIKELKQYGYMRRERRQNEQGKFEWETIVYEEPYTENPSMEKPSMENPSMENPQLLNNKELNNNSLNNEDNLVVVEEKAPQLYQKYFGPPSSREMLSILYWIRQLNDELVSEAITRAVQKGKEWDYAVGILREWQQHNLRTITDIEVYEEQWRKKKEEVNDREVHKHRRGVSRLAKEGKSYEQILREAEAARKAWGG